jgi:hypothetical protein
MHARIPSASVDRRVRRSIMSANAPAGRLNRNIGKVVAA